MAVWVSSSILAVFTNVSNVWTVTKPSYSLDLAGPSAVAREAGWYVFWKQNSPASTVLLQVGDSVPLTGGNGTIWNFTGPVP